MRRPGLPPYSPPVAAIFPLMVEAAPGTKVTNLAEPLMPLKCFPKLRLSPEVEKDILDDL